MPTETCQTAGAATAATGERPCARDRRPWFPRAGPCQKAVIFSGNFEDARNPARLLVDDLPASPADAQSAREIRELFTRSSSASVGAPTIRGRSIAGSRIGCGFARGAIARQPENSREAPPIGRAESKKHLNSASSRPGVGSLAEPRGPPERPSQTFFPLILAVFAERSRDALNGGSALIEKQPAAR